ncbi:ABC transporter ATP-binding protein [Virgibacillus litoralis]|uniref:ABC-2 type transport system ATP-binding protein n=1 Tax=Virgibacillus litoralis TaxID=578221 RepID=A0ABS4HCA6_9BACI|nr:ABC transporter ATP-binding protein [Virgibacillus litoralis]MBP1948468.1 ABC-2 type transport system ATP-binding protein [Virgibacillus litoralis]
MPITINGLTKEFSNGKGIFDISFTVADGEVFGFLGPNGAGKSTTIRHLMGFMKPTSGSVEINQLDCWKNSAEIQKSVGYLPGETAFLEGMTGKEFLNLLAGMRNMKHTKRQKELIERFQFNVNTPIRKMSKGMKQKVGIVAAFMHDPEVLILDEPTSGLDPLMQSIFVELISEEKDKGKTILMSSHSFSEIDRTSDRVGIIKGGELVAIEEIRKLQTIQRKIFDVTVKSEEDITIIRNSPLEVLQTEQLRVQITVQGDYEQFVKIISNCGINSIDVHHQNLEDIFMHFYEMDGDSK